MNTSKNSAMLAAVRLIATAALLGIVAVVSPQGVW
jgi:hypothetical protein